MKVMAELRPPRSTSLLTDFEGLTRLRNDQPEGDEAALVRPSPAQNARPEGPQDAAVGRAIGISGDLKTASL